MNITSGSITNLVKMNALENKWEQKKKKMTKAERNRVRTPVELMMENFKTQLVESRKNEAVNRINEKVAGGEDLTQEEINYLRQKNPTLLKTYEDAKREEKEYAKKLEKCKTKEEVDRVKMQKVQEIFSELKAADKTANKSVRVAAAEAALAKLNRVRKVNLKFAESGKEDVLPSEEEERAEEARDKARKNDRIEEKFVEKAGERAAEEKEKAEEAFEDSKIDEIFDKRARKKASLLEEPKEIFVPEDEETEYVDGNVRSSYDNSNVSINSARDKRRRRRTETEEDDTETVIKQILNYSANIISQYSQGVNMLM